MFLRKIINHYLNFRPVWNDGISFGMLQGYGNLGRVIFIVIALIISLWIIIYSKKLNTIGFVGYNMIAGGAIGNVIDRFIHGKVIDFIDVHYKAYHWPAFNMADSFIFIGVLFNESLNPLIPAKQTPMFVLNLLQIKFALSCTKFSVGGFLYKLDGALKRVKKEFELLVIIVP